MVEGPVDPGRRAEAAWLQRWTLEPVAPSVVTASSTLTPVETADGTPAMLKVSHTEEETRGARLMQAWDGRGAARVLMLQEDAVLLERATGARSLTAMAVANADADDAATRVVCATARRLHEASADALTADPPLVPLRTWFRALLDRSPLSPFHANGAALAHRLLAETRMPVVLHGDLHHGNVLDFGERGWLAIDPKGLRGEAAFDYCNVLCNPSHAHALEPGRLERQLAVVADAAGLDPERLARWLAAWCALSSTWFALDGDPGLSASAAAIGERALALLSPGA